MSARFIIFIIFLLGLTGILVLRNYKDYKPEAPITFKLIDPNKPMVAEEKPEEVEEEDTPEMISKRGKEVYEKKGQCITCHGADGLGLVEKNAPRLAGQFDWYVKEQLVSFQKKIRINEEMAPYIKDLTENDFQDVAFYISRMSAKQI